MKKILVLLLVLIPFIAICGGKYKRKVIKPGRWRETVRMLPDSTSLMFRDTLYMRFMAKDSFSYHHRNGFVYEGVFRLSEDSILDLGTVRYKVLEAKDDRLVFMNSKGVYHFNVDHSDTAEVIVLDKNDTARPVTHIDSMIGKWTVYKRASEGFGKISADENIRSAYITGQSTDGKQGYLYSGSDPDNRPSWYITELGAGQSLNCDGKGLRTLKVLRCQDREMILEENGNKYFFKLNK